MAEKVITVYVKPSCVQCDATKRWLKSKGLDYTEADALENLDALKNVIGYQQAPVIKVFNPKDSTTTFWSGHNPIELDKLLVA